MKYTPADVTQAFLEHAERLRSSSFFTNELRLRSFTPEQDDRPDNPSNDLVDTESVHSFVLTLRFFIQDNEPTSLRKFYSETLPHLDLDDDCIGRLHEIRDAINRYLDSRLLLPWTIGKERHKIETHRELMETYVYGRLAHGNRLKRALARALDSYMMTKAFATVAFLEILKNLGNGINQIALTLEAGLQSSVPAAPNS